jgi:hypothetical protein
MQADGHAVNTWRAFILWEQNVEGIRATVKMMVRVET